MLFYKITGKCDKSGRKSTLVAVIGLKIIKGDHMAGETITKKVASLAELYLEENNLELWDIEFLKEGRDWFLRIYIDKKSHDSL